MKEKTKGGAKSLLGEETKKWVRGRLEPGSTLKKESFTSSQGRGKPLKKKREK